MKYFLKFKKNYPTITSLANASEDSILNDWQGLGYYSRARNLHYTAKFIRDNYGGIFPSVYKEIIALKGIGEYTAAAISSFAFGQNYAVVDGNVFRLLSRVFNVDMAIDTNEGKKYFQSLANELIDPTNPAIHNQAIMEVGALVCTPKKPNCLNCPLSHMCLAKANNTIHALPVKAKKTKATERYFHFLIFQNNTEIVIDKRIDKDIWQHLYQFPLVESDSFATPNVDFFKLNHTVSKEVNHLLSHQKIRAKFYHFSAIPEELKDTWIKIPKGTIQNFPLPRIIDRYLENNEY